MSPGIDIVEISRIPLTESFLKGVLSPNEIAQLEQRSDKKSFVAGRFAAKEAFMKATGKGLALCRLSEIEVLSKEGGAPYLLYKGKEYGVSISHDGGFAIAIVLI